MPRIKSVENRVETQGPVNSPQAQASDFGDFRGLSAVGQGLDAVGDFVQKRREQSDVSTMSAQLSKARLDWTTNLQERLKTADPNDAEFVSNFQQELDDYISELGKNASTDKGSIYFTEQAAQLRTSLLTNAIAGASELAGVKAKQDWQTAVSSNSGAVLSDPSSFEAVMSSNKAMTQSLVETGAISSAQAMELEAKANTETAKSAIKGMANLNPDAAKEMINSGKFDPYIGTMKDQLLGEVDQAKRGQLIEQERVKKQQEEALKVEQMATQNDFLGKITTGKLNTKMVLNSNLPPFGSGSKEQFLQMMETHNKQRANKSDPQVFLNTFARINLPDGDPKKIVDENDLNGLVVAGKLSFEDLGKLRGEIQGKRTEAGGIESQLKKGLLDVAKGSLTRSNPLTGIRDPRGDEQLQAFTSFFLTEYADQRKKGKSAKDLLDPTSPDYMGKAIRNYARTPEQIMKDLAGGFNSDPIEVAPTDSRVTPPPDENRRKDGETIASWKKRTGKGS